MMLQDRPDYHKLLEDLQYLCIHMHSRWSMDPTLTPDQQVKVSVTQMFLKKALETWTYADGEEPTYDQLDA